MRNTTALPLARPFIALLLLAFASRDPAAQQSTGGSTTGSRRLNKITEMYYGYKAEAFQDVNDISIERLLDRMDYAGGVLVDVREEEETDVSMIPGALTKREFEHRKRDVKDSTVIVYCTIGYRSGIYAARLKKKGYSVYNLVGGALAWAHAGQDFRCDTEFTKRVHVYDRKWDLAPLDYESTW